MRVTYEVTTDAGDVVTFRRDGRTRTLTVTSGDREVTIELAPSELSYLNALAIAAFGSRGVAVPR